MKRALRWLGIGVALIAIGLGIAWYALLPRHPSQQEITARMQAQAALSGGAKLYAASCAYCHDAKLAPTLRGLGLERAAVAVMVRHGAGAMPAFSEAMLSDAQLTELTAYIDKLPAAAGT